MTDEREEELLARGLAREVAVADRVALPRAPIDWKGGLVRWSGWLAAGVLAAVLMHDRARSGDASPAPALEPPPLDASSLATQLVSTGAPSLTVGELSTTMIDSRRSPDGGYDVLFERRTIERAHVAELVELANDELGNPTNVLVPVAAPLATEGM